MPGDGGEGTGGAEAASGAEKASSGSLPKASSWKALKANVRVESSRKAFARTLTDVRKNYGAQVVPEGQDAGGGEDNDDGSLQRDVGAPGTQRRKMQLYIHPEGSFRRNWDMSQALVLFYLAVRTVARAHASASATAASARTHERTEHTTKRTGYGSVPSRL